MRWLLLIIVSGGCGRAIGSLDAGARCDADTAVQFERACTASSDCSVLNHQLDCCGSQQVIGVASKGLAEAQRQEDACVARGPFCRCLARAPIAEDGKEVVTGASVTVACPAGRCTTFVP